MTPNDTITALAREYAEFTPQNICMKLSISLCILCKAIRLAKARPMSRY